MHPLEMLQLSRQHLRQGGRVLISVPNAGETLKAGPSWIGFRVDLEHLNYFSLPTLSRTLRVCGIEVTDSWEHLEPDLGQRSSWSVRLTNLRHVAMQIVTAKEPPLAKGSFVLTVLGKAA
jgi:hypothetical protein